MILVLCCCFLLRDRGSVTPVTWREMSCKSPRTQMEYTNRWERKPTPNGANSLENRQLLKQLNTQLPRDPAIPLFGIFPREMKGYVRTKTCTWMFTALFICHRQKLETTQRSIHQGVGYIHKMELYSAVKRNELLTYTISQMNHKILIRWLKDARQNWVHITWFLLQ